MRRTRSFKAQNKDSSKESPAGASERRRVKRTREDEQRLQQRQLEHDHTHHDTGLEEALGETAAIRKGAHMVARKSRNRKTVKSLRAKRLTSRQAKRVKGGGLPAATNTVSSPLINEVGFPALDAGSKDPAKMSVKVTNQFVNPKF